MSWPALSWTGPRHARPCRGGSPAHHITIWSVLLDQKYIVGNLYCTHLHIAVHGCKFVDLPFLSAPSLLDRLVIVVELVLCHAGAEVRRGAVGPVVRGPREARRGAGAEHHPVVVAEAGGVEVCWGTRYSHRSS